MKVVVVLLSTFALTFGLIIPPHKSRIVGGRPTTIEEHPYQISLRRDDRHFCGGSIINKDTILTAAHCVHGFNHKSYTIRVGSTGRNTGQKYEVAEIIEHTNFSSEIYFNNDMTIIKLAKPLTFNNKVQPIALQPRDEEVPIGTTAYVTGWGTTGEGVHVSPDELRVVDVDVIANEECEDSYAGSMTITSEMLCAQTPGHDSCQGDSGGPLVANGKLIGVVSWGFGCANPVYPGVYSNVATMHDFIDAYI